MAVFIAAADGNLSSAGAVWKTVDATMFLYSTAANTAMTTAYVESAGTIPGAITVTGHAVLVQGRVASPTGTFSTRLATGGVLVAGTEVTINVSDMERPGGAGLHGPGWYFVKYAAPVVLLAATTYTTSAKCSVNGEVTLWRNATAGNWSRMHRTDTFGNPGAGDDMHILGEWTAAATKTDRVVTMDETAVTDYGSGDTNLNQQGFTIGKGGTLTFGAAAATNYLLQLSTGLRVWKGGILNIGTVGTPIPADSTATLQFDCVADGDFGLFVDGTINVQGVARTPGINIVQTLLNTDEAAAQTVLGVADSTGWKNGDNVIIAPTTRTASQVESRTLAADAGASSITVSAGLTNAHSGTSPTQAEVINLTRNVIIKSVSTTAMSYVLMGDAGIGDFDWTVFRNIGVTTDYKRGVQLRTTSGSCAIDYCSFDNFEVYGIYIGADNVIALDNVAVRNCVFSALHNAASISAAVGWGNITNGTNVTTANLTVVGVDGNAGAQFGFDIGAGSPFASHSGWRATGCQGDGFNLDGTMLINGVHAHSNNDQGLFAGGASWQKLLDVHIWRNNNSSSAGGFAVQGTGPKEVIGGQVFGNGGATNQNIRLGQGGYLIMRGVTVAADTSFAVVTGIGFVGGAAHAIVVLDGCDFSPTSGIFVPHTNDIDSDGHFNEFTIVNTPLRAANEIINTANNFGLSVIRYQRQDGTTNIHKKTYPTLGTVSYETGTFRTASPGEKMAPSGAAPNFPLESTPFRVRVDVGDTVSVAVYGQKDASYSGMSAQLVLKSNYAVGVNGDTILDTHTAAINTWEQLTGTSPVALEDGVLEFVVRVSGTGGAFYVDDWSAS